jgi:hypothetical protein
MGEVVRPQDVEIPGRSYAQQPGWCDRHGLAMVPCMYCEDPTLLAWAHEAIEGDG